MSNVVCRVRVRTQDSVLGNRAQHASFMLTRAVSYCTRAVRVRSRPRLLPPSAAPGKHWAPGPRHCTRAGGEGRSPSSDSAALHFGSVSESLGCV